MSEGIWARTLRLERTGAVHDLHTSHGEALEEQEHVPWRLAVRGMVRASPYSHSGPLRARRRPTPPTRPLRSPHQHLRASSTRRTGAGDGRRRAALDPPATGVPCLVWREDRCRERRNPSGATTRVPSRRCPAGAPPDCAAHDARGVLQVERRADGRFTPSSHPGSCVTVIVMLLHGAAHGRGAAMHGRVSGMEERKRS
jgi:hypothetical protein